MIDDDRCLSCDRPTVDTDDRDNPLRAVEAPSGAYVLCARCHDIAVREYCERNPAETTP